ncbi:hypothetical protein LUZ60_006552 [Juncus effusus]|nr:hypothetical protein LUZ60_006552 [Juncus effusus]
MARRNNMLSSLFRSLTLWVPRRSENISREFWMPDNSCRVCYECDTEFTLFNRRHHCRQCGRIFCGSCTKNSIPACSATLCNDSSTFESNGSTERLRACNYCFKQWQKEMEKKTKLINPNMSSMLSMGNDRLDGNNGRDINDGTSIFYQGANHNSNEDSTKPESVMDLSEEREIFSTAHFGFLMTRSDNESEAYSDNFQSSYDSQHGSNSYYPCSDISNTSPSRDEIKLSDGTSSTFDEKQDNESDTNNSHHDYTASSTLYEITSTKSILDLHGNLALWSPPEPENMEDEEMEIYDDQIQFNDSSRESDNNTVSTECDHDSMTDDQEETSQNTPEDKFKLVLFQLLYNEGIQTDCEDGIMSWVDIIESLARNVAYVVKPDTSNGGSMDPIGYVKIKCLASGNRDESTVVKGIICKKNTAHRRMATRLENPNILILGGCLEYQRVLRSLLSIDTLLQQEREHLKMAIMKIEAQKPDLLLVEKTVARSAQDLLLHKKIPLVLNIKKPLLQHIAQCTGAAIAPSIDQLSPKLMGTCESFHIDKFIEEHECPEKGTKMPIKNMMFLEGCPNPASCTILLRGASLDVLKKVKHIIRVAIFVAYHASLEKSFLEDERASLPESSLKAPITVPLPNIPLTTNSSICIVPGFRLCGEKYPTNGYLSQSRESFMGSSSNIKGYAKISNLDDPTECDTVIKDKLFLEDNRNVVYLSDSIGSGSPTCLAKVFGIYQVTSKNIKGGKEQKIDVLIMENLLFDHNFTRLYDLKGSTRSRYNPDTSGNNKVLLDENLIEAMPTSPIFVWKKAKRLLERAIWNDTYFLASIGVMDYSLLVGVDEEQDKLTVGIIDFMRQYTWDKHLESWVKASGILGGPKNVSPTVISPKEYKVRFRKAMSLYFLVIPDDWTPDSKESENNEIRHEKNVAPRMNCERKPSQ